MKKHGTANILLVELVLVILFFMLCMPTIVRSFGDARLKSNYAQASSEAMTLAENMEERLALAADTAGELEKGGFVREGDKWTLQRKPACCGSCSFPRRRIPAGPCLSCRR